MPDAPRGRGAGYNPANRFIPLYYEEDPARLDPDGPAPRTELYHDRTRSILATNDSPDVGFTHSINPYRGCEHGCVYCFARPFHEYLGLSAGLDFETKIMVKPDASKLLRKELMAKSWKPVAISLSGVTDCYQPAERRLRITRGCLEVLAEFRNPFGIVTKNHLVTRDIDVIAPMAKLNAAAVFLSVTTLDAELARLMEPRASAPEARLNAIRELSAAAVPAGALIAPVIPGLNDHEIPAILAAVKKAGARCAGYVLLRLPFAIKDLFADWLGQHYPERKEKVLSRLREFRDGRLYDSRFGHRMSGEGPLAEMVNSLFEVHRARLGLGEHGPELSTAHFKRPGLSQQLMFE